MKDVLIDTEALIWFIEGSSRLSVEARAAIDSSSVRQFVSAASIWEMAIKVRLGKLTLGSGTLQELVASLPPQDIRSLDITFEDALFVQALPAGKHQDPFDRLIAAQCLRLNLSLVSCDRAFDAYAVQRIW